MNHAIIKNSNLSSLTKNKFIHIILTSLNALRSNNMLLQMKFSNSQAFKMVYKNHYDVLEISTNATPLEVINSLIHQYSYLMIIFI